MAKPDKIVPTTMRFPPELKRRLAKVVDVANKQPAKGTALRGRVSASSLVIQWTEEGVTRLERALNITPPAYGNGNGGKKPGGALD